MHDSRERKPGRDGRRVEERGARQGGRERGKGRKNQNGTSRRSDADDGRSLSPIEPELDSRPQRAPTRPFFRFSPPPRRRLVPARAVVGSAKAAWSAKRAAESIAPLPRRALALLFFFFPSKRHSSEQSRGASQQTQLALTLAPSPRNPLSPLSGWCLSAHLRCAFLSSASDAPFSTPSVL